MEKVETSLFDGVTDEEYARMTECFKTTLKTHRKGEEVAMPPGRVGVVHRGRISLMKTDESGVRTIFEQLGEGGVFGSMLGIAGGDTGFFLIAEEDCDVLYVDYDHIMKRCPNACTYHSTIVRNLVRLMAEKTQALSEHLEVLSHRTTREKLLAYFRLLAAKTHSQYFTLPFSQTNLADYLCVDRSAMLRELAGMHRDGLVEVDRRNIKLNLHKAQG